MNVYGEIAKTREKLMNVYEEIAKRYRDSDLSVIPITNGTKEPSWHALRATVPDAQPRAPNDPSAPWRRYSRVAATRQEVTTWYRDGWHSVGICCGAVSGGLVVIDFEHPACYPTWCKLVAEKSLTAAAAACTVVQTSKGHHVYFRMPDPPGHMLLSHHGTGRDLMVLSETQGEGCYVVAPPSVVANYCQGGSYMPYRTIQGGMWDIVRFEQQIGVQLIASAAFPNLFETVLTSTMTPYDDTTMTLHRSGITLQQAERLGGDYWSLDWQQVFHLSEYLTRYNDLIRAVETAPPPPPSYDEDRDDEYEED